VEFDAVRDAYSSKSQQYVDLFGEDWRPHEVDVAFIRRHLVGSEGPVLDLGCGPGHWTAYLHRLGVEVTGIDLVPEFIGHARASHPGPEFRLGSMTDVHAPEHSVAGVLSWYSTIHVPPAELGGVLTGFRRFLAPSGTLVLGYFEGDDEVASFDHAVVEAYRWPADLLSQRLAETGFVEVERLQRRVAERPDRKFAAIAACAV
jgi:2-polyprenyl-3-methyl-5-hydroxy-6-metoxy-1,4-benzoquinol methylase